MKLYYSKASPFARKVRVTAIEKGIEARVDLIETSPMQDDPALLEVNPIGKIPALVTDDGMALCDSPLICEYIDALVKENRLYPKSGKRHWKIAQLTALGDGLMDAGVAIRIESYREPQYQSEKFVARQREKALRTAKALRSWVRVLNGPVTLGHISVACALAYLDFRFPDLDWRKGNARLATWFEEFSKRPSMVKTKPE
ncbi:MAG: glutathione S-transferase N-terminal domain-containing protein [Alphaproteobacteria bacterium]|nr:glutathione S-transferase N-terminal domain-containing protein [Alphaproteobacteria bacterium]